MAATQCYLGASTPFGVIVFVTDQVYNARATVRTDDGSTRTYRLPFLLAHGFTLAQGETETPLKPQEPRQQAHPGY